MVYYHRLGEIPRKRHTVFRNSDGALYHEELIGNKGFTGVSSLLYHIEPPTRVREAGTIEKSEVEASSDPSLRHRHYRTSGIERGGTPVESRRVLLFNDDVRIGVSRPDSSPDCFYRNGEADELLYVSHGRGTLESPFGQLSYDEGDYLIIPRGIIHRLEIDTSVEHRYLVVEAKGVIDTPKRYRNPHGQHIEGAPYSERDFRAPSELVTKDETGQFELRVRQHGGLHRYVLDRHPFDVVGWDGYYYPWAFNIHDFEPIVGRIHQPPPVHQVFEADGFVVCNFVPRLYDFDENAIAVPYNHTNAQSDEVIYYAREKFMSRRGIEYGSITLHPDGITHGPQPGAVEAGFGKSATDELAVMVDTFRPLRWSRTAEEIEDTNYWKSWLGE